ncbi:MAG: SPOR domain-containing protein [Candidatus Eisenbacteria sp.]|nr:SPOR domain-containing protein [Candidatus Eisenbacteria bacterium]
MSQREPAGEGEYFADVADLEGSLDLPVLGRLESEPRFYQRQAILSRLAPDPSVAERLCNFVRIESPAIWVVGLGEGGVELPMAVGLAERFAASGVVPVLLVGPESERPPGMGEKGLRPVIPGQFGVCLGKVFPGGCGAQPSGIQGVFRVWPGSDADAMPVEAAGLVVASRWSEDFLKPPVDGVTGVVAVVPFQDERAVEITERVTTLRSLGYPLMGMVALSAPGVDRQVKKHAPSKRIHEMGIGDTEVGVGKGGTMEGMANGNDRVTDDSMVDEEVKPAFGGEVTDSGSSFAETPDGEEADRREMGDSDGSKENVSVQQPWSASYGPRRDAGGRGYGGGSRHQFWLWGAFILVVLAAGAFLASRMIGGSDSNQFAEDLSPLGSGDASSADVAMLADSSAEDVLAGQEVPDAGRSESTVGASPTAAPVTGERTVLKPPVETRGDAAVETRAKPPQETSPPAVAEKGATPQRQVVRASGEPPFGVSCGAFRETARAVSQAARLKKLGLEARVVTVQIPGKGTWNRVVVGHWLDLAQARTYAHRIVSAGHVKDALVVAADGYGVPVGTAIKP